MTRASLRGQSGAALLIALILMTVLTIVAAATLRFSISGLRVAVNEELRSEALQSAQSLVDAVLSVPANLMITAAIDETNCVPGVTGCTYNTLVLTDANAQQIFQRADSVGAVLVRRIGPEVSTPPRNTNYSAVRFQASYLRVESAYDGTAGGWGQAALNEGVTVIVPMLGG